ncbi:MAG: thrombospondin type 3 repeat-containing protein [Gammaproteobacteria bacterium]
MNTWIKCLAMLTALWTPVALATITITFYPAPNDGTTAHITGTGTKMSPGGGISLNWANLVGGDPFDASLQSTQFQLATPLGFTSSADIVALNFDSDGTGSNQDDFTIRFSDLFSFEDAYQIDDESVVTGLDFALLNPGVYTRPDSTVGGITMIISDSPPSDSDGDGVDDAADNCSETANSNQRDTDGDNIGNVCDADFNQDCAVNFLDLSIFSSNFLLAGDLNTDLNGDGQTNFADLAILASRFFVPTGPSGLPNDCES